MTARSSLRYRELLNDIGSDIRQGIYAVGEDLPTEAQLCDRYGVSRFTVREALRRLEGAGLIATQQGRGSRVVSSVSQNYTLVAQSEADVLRYTAGTYVELRNHRKKVSAARARRLRLGDPTKWSYVSGRRRLVEDRRPIALLDVYLLEEFSDILDALESPVVGAIFPRIVEHYGVGLARIEQRISAVELPASAARQLEAEAGSPGLQIVRTFWSSDTERFEVSFSLHPADRFEFALSVEPQQR